ncbi:transposase [Burkholderia cepacia]|uniref:IS5 family transposase n=1 Tax=Burkholderia cepacia TaxID=292 RepID=UPI00075B5513|nr:IS5 family transposase [Burkholderia cepacia]KWH39380.1 transposase [Burkholderia cepacia]
MRGANSYNESLFSTVRQEEVVPQAHPLRKIRMWLIEALSKMNAKFSAMYEVDVKGGRPSIAPEKLMRAMLLQVLYSIRSERQLVEQISYNLPFRRFVDPSIEDVVSNHSVFSKNRDRLLEFDAVTELFNATMEAAQKRGLLSEEHFSVDDTLIQDRASHKRIRRKDGSYDDQPPGKWHNQPRSNETHKSKSDGGSRLCRKNNVAPALPSYLGRVLTDNRHGLVVNVKASRANGRAELAAEMLREVARPDRRIEAGADKAYDTRGFIKACRDANVTPHVARNTKRSGGSVIDKRTTRHLGYALSQRKRNGTVQCFGLGLTLGPLRQVMVRGLEKVDQLLTLTIVAYNLTQLRSLAALRPQSA